MKKYRYWDIYEEMPEGWAVIEGVGSPLFEHVFICNQKSRFSGEYKTALLKLKKKVNTNN